MLCLLLLLPMMMMILVMSQAWASQEVEEVGAIRHVRRGIRMGVQRIRRVGASGSKVAEGDAAHLGPIDLDISHSLPPSTSPLCSIIRHKQAQVRRTSRPLLGSRD